MSLNTVRVEFSSHATAWDKHQTKNTQSYKDKTKCKPIMARTQYAYNNHTGNSVGTTCNSSPKKKTRVTSKNSHKSFADTVRAGTPKEKINKSNKNKVMRYSNLYNSSLASSLKLNFPLEESCYRAYSECGIF